MKKIKIVTLSLLLFAGSVKTIAQEIELLPLFGSIFQSTYYGYDGRLVFRTGVAFGGVVNYKPNKFIDVGISVINQNTKADAYYQDYTYQEELGIPVGVINYQLSVVRNFHLNGSGKVIPFFGMDAGAVDFYEQSGSRDHYVKMSVGFRGGVKFQLTSFLNLRIQPQVEMPIQGIGVGVGVGTGGASVGTTTYSSIVQFGVLGGLGFTLPMIGKSNAGNANQ